MACIAAEAWLCPLRAFRGMRLSAGRPGRDRAAGRRAQQVTNHLTGLLFHG